MKNTYKLSHTRQCETLGLTIAALSRKAQAMEERAVLDGWTVSCVSYGPGVINAPAQWIKLELSRDIVVEEQ